jgi:hypothetical protein
LRAKFPEPGYSFLLPELNILHQHEQTLRIPVLADLNLSLSEPGTTVPFPVLFIHVRGFFHLPYRLNPCGLLQYLHESVLTGMPVAC